MQFLWINLHWISLFFHLCFLFTLNSSIIWKFLQIRSDEAQNKLVNKLEIIMGFTQRMREATYYKYY